MSEWLVLNGRGPWFFRSGRAMGGLTIVALVCLAALLAPCITPHDPYEQDLRARRQPPSLQHPLGLDEVGRDNLSRLLHGARLSLRVGLTSILLAVLGGGLLGAVAGYRGGWLDGLLMSLMDLLQAFPTLLLAIAVVMILGRGLTNVLYAIALTAMPTYARLLRVGVLTVKVQDYVEAARALGVPPTRLLGRHILPNCLTPLLVQATLGIGTAILEAAGLSFLGLGAEPPNPEWGAMIAQGRGAVFAAPHIVVFPGLALMLTILGFNLLGDGLRQALDRRR